MKKNLRELKVLNKKYNVAITIDQDMPDLSNDPFILAKKEKAEKFFAVNGFPESIQKPKAQSQKPKTTTSPKSTA